MVEFVKLMSELNQDIKPYVVIGTITADQYKQFTGKDYAPAGQPAQLDTQSPLKYTIHSEKRTKALKI